MISTGFGFFEFTHVKIARLKPLPGGYDSE